MIFLCYTQYIIKVICGGGADFKCSTSASLLCKAPRQRGSRRYFGAFFALSFSASSFPFSSVLERYALLIRFSFCFPNGYYRKHRNFFKKGKILLFPIAISFFLCYNTIVMIRWQKNFIHGALAQLGAHHTGSVGVVGSNPICSTRVPKA